MRSLVLDPSMTRAHRAAALNRSAVSIQGSSQRLRELFDSGTTPLRIVLAERIGMPFSTMVARIHVDGDPGLSQRVLSKINPGHREAVAKLLLTVQPGTDADVNI